MKNAVLKNTVSLITSTAKSPFAISISALVFFLGNVLSRFPGINNPDSRHQYDQALSGHYTDWHPPVMAWLWSILHRLGDGSGPLYVFHLFFYWFGFGLIALTFNQIGRRYAAWIILAIGLFPSFMMMDVAILKDVGLATTFLTVFAILFWHRAQNKKINAAIYIIVSLLLLYGIFVRANGIFAAAPLLIYMFYPKLLMRPARLTALCMAIILLTISFYTVLNQKIFHATPTYPIRSLQIYDIAGIAKFAQDTSLFGPNSAITSQQVSDCYIPQQWDTMSTLGKCHIFWDTLALPADATSSRKPDGGGGEDAPNPNLTNLWLTAIAKHPLAYIEHRIFHFNSELYFIVPRHHADFRVLFHIVYGKPIDLSEFQTTKSRIMDYLRYNPFSTPAFAFVLSIILLILAWPRSTKNQLPLQQDIFCLAISGFLYTSIYFVIGIASDTRYHFWTMMAVFIGLAIYASGPQHHFRPMSRVGWICIAILLSTAAMILGANIALGDPLFSK